MLRVIKANQTIPRCMFAELVDDYGDSVYKFCRSLTYSKEDADDLFQETFLRVLEQLPKVDNSENPKGFLFSSALYIWKGWKRRYARRKRLAPTEPFDEAAAGGESMEEDFLVREEAHIVRELVESLPDKFKVPVILYYTVEMSVPDIALSMKIPPGTVKSRLFKARKLIEKGLKEHEE
ncbi:RNA polymerase sigma-70 factor (ECF subfamily) [Ruminiclostridium sufflavum DSM 19573]|uniref:RNA polymerase sigma-70 factor (ECF subfamily) n=2 Tax=Ruminiclostridium TaxID=1508657 RepID=A0A318XPB5_9FIRM|nr:RNA polymerase sigma-70 factor (ECF subfamily) [Ruminiclostridium sufflavum DSM 19573]